MLERMGNLLTYRDSFIWSDVEKDRSSDINNLNNALMLASNNKDNLYYHPDFYDNKPTLDFFISLWNGYEAFKERYPWIKESEFQILASLQYYFRSSPDSSRNLSDLQALNGNENSAWIGFKCECPEYLVFDKTTWFTFHAVYVSTFNREQRLNNKRYFLKFYKPHLKTDANRIKKLIERNMVNNNFKRIDMPSTDARGEILHGEQIHMHFNDTNDSALNIDGTWKHGGFDLSNVEADTLIEWGFLLPENLN